MPTFRWPDTSYDIALAKEVVSSRPTKPVDWDLIANNLNVVFSSENVQVSLKGRGCKERMERLLNKYRTEDTASIRRRGTEEEYYELSQLLADISSYMGDLASLQKRVREAKSKEDKQKSKEIKAVMERLLTSKRKRRHDETGTSPGPDTSSGASSAESDVEEIAEMELAIDDKSKKAKGSKGESSSLKRASKLSATEILDQRFTKKTELKEKELELRRMELELQKRKMEGEEEERKQRLQLELEERRALLELLKKHL